MHSTHASKNEFSAYTNTTPRKYFLQVSKEVYWNNLKEKILHRSFYSISVDDRTDQIMEHQLIIYITYLTNEGRGTYATKFIHLLQIRDEASQSMYDVVTSLLAKMNLSMAKLVGFGSNGASFMRGIRNGLPTKLHRHAPHLLNIQCIIHREALTTNDVSSYF